MSVLAPAIPVAAPADPDSKRNFQSGSLVIREKTLVMGNSIYPIENISTVTLSDLRKPVPMRVWAALGFAILLLSMGGVWAALGLGLLVTAAVMCFQYLETRPVAKFSLAIRMNGGNTALVLSDDEPFLKSIALELHKVIELNVPSYTTFNIDQRVKIDNLTGSTLRVSGIQGDIVNNVHGA